jgi:hypothetical protein
MSEPFPNANICEKHERAGIGLGPCPYCKIGTLRTRVQELEKYQQRYYDELDRNKGLIASQGKYLAIVEKAKVAISHMSSHGAKCIVTKVGDKSTPEGEFLEALATLDKPMTTERYCHNCQNTGKMPADKTGEWGPATKPCPYCSHLEDKPTSRPPELNEPCPPECGCLDTPCPTCGGEGGKPCTVCRPDNHRWAVCDGDGWIPCPDCTVCEKCGGTGHDVADHL